MFSAISNCCVSPKEDTSFTPIHKGAFVADIITGLALLTIGVVGVYTSQPGLPLPAAISFTALGIGGTYITLVTTALLMMIKNESKFSDKYLYGRDSEQ